MPVPISLGFDIAGLVKNAKMPNTNILNRTFVFLLSVAILEIVGLDSVKELFDLVKDKATAVVIFHPGIPDKFNDHMHVIYELTHATASGVVQRVAQWLTSSIKGKVIDTAALRDHLKACNEEILCENQVDTAQAIFTTSPEGTQANNMASKLTFHGLFKKLKEKGLLIPGKEYDSCLDHLKNPKIASHSRVIDHELDESQIKPSKHKWAKSTGNKIETWEEVEEIIQESNANCPEIFRAQLDNETFKQLYAIGGLTW